MGYNFLVLSQIRFVFVEFRISRIFLLSFSRIPRIFLNIVCWVLFICCNCFPMQALVEVSTEYTEFSKSLILDYSFIFPLRICLLGPECFPSVRSPNFQFVFYPIFEKYGLAKIFVFRNYFSFAVINFELFGMGDIDHNFCFWVIFLHFPPSCLPS